RTLIIWPLVYVTATIIFREISVTGSALFKRSTLKRLTCTFVGACLVIIMLLGLQIWIDTWSIVLDHTYFGPPWRLTAMDRATDLMPTHRVVFINPWVHRDTIEISLYEQNKKLGGNSLMFANIGKNSTKFRQFLAPNKPTAFFYFELNNQEWLKDVLQTGIPGGHLEEVRNEKGRKELLYSVYNVYNN
ncbi:hypothetical protein K8T06_06280, partial [bacterium]|nr:hypothetical protein [bacterium]